MAAALLAASIASAHASGVVQIELHPLVQAAGADVTLGEIAALTTGDLPLLKKLMAVPLGSAPRAGETVGLSRIELARWIQVRTGLREDQLEWKGPLATQVQRAASEVSGERLAAAAGESLREWLAARSTRAEIELTSVPRDVAVPAGALVVKARAIPHDQPIARRTSVWLDLWVDGQFVRTVPVGFDVTAYGPAYVAAQDAPAGAPADFTRPQLREVPLAGRSVEPIARRPSGAQQLVHPVAVGQVITARDVQPRPAVTRGDWVPLRIRSGGMELESRAEVLQNGGVGQLVNVKPRGATGTLEARVLGPGRVEIDQ